MAFILNYGAEIWGYTKSKEIESIRLKFGKRFLNVRKTHVMLVCMENLGNPLYVHRFVCIFQYLFKILNSDNIIICKVYAQALSYCINGRKNWVTNV